MRPATQSRTRSKRRSPERSLHMSVESFLRRAWPVDLPYTHFPAGEARDGATGAKLKAMGLKPGWADFIFIMPNGQAAFLELKAVGGELSVVQIDVRSLLLALRCGYVVATSLEEVEAALERWLSLFGRTLRARLITRRAT